MSDIQITIELPEELIERARSVGLDLENQRDEIISLLEAQVRRREAAAQLSEIGVQLQALPPEMKPTPEDIEAEIREHRAEVTHQQ